MKTYDLVVVGGGPAGLMAAISAKQLCSALSVVVLEKMKSPGRKLLISGKGQCNITRSGDIRGFIDHYGDNGRFLKHALFSFTNIDLQSFFADGGCPICEREDRKIFPASFKSGDVLGTLLNKIYDLEIELCTEARVSGIINKDGLYHITGSFPDVSSRSVVLATGGKSYPLTGSTGEGYNFALKLGHALVKPVPALCGISVENFNLSDCAGVTVSVSVSVFKKSKKCRSATDQMLITHSGFSGPAILHITRYLEEGSRLEINFLSDINYEQLDSFLLSKRSYRSVVSVMAELLPKRLAESLILVSGVHPKTSSSEISRNQRKTIVKNFTSHPVIEYRTGTFDEAMVTAGGIKLKEVNPKTMGSRLSPGLFFAGEVLDFDGDTGGYNLQAAFSTGYCAGKSVAFYVNVLSV